MGILKKLFGIKSEQKEVVHDANVIDTKSDLFIGGLGSGGYGGASWPILPKQFDGEKTPGELGIVIKDIPDYRRLRLRGYHAYVTTDVIKTLTSRRIQWTIGNGLKLEFDPNKDVLRQEGILQVPEKISKETEERFKVYTNSRHIDIEKRRNLHKLAEECYEDVFKGGDSLVIQRINEDYNLEIQVIMGEHVKNPCLLSDAFKEKGEDNVIEHGIEFNEHGEHVAYYVEIQVPNEISKFKRVPAYGNNSKQRLAWMVYGSKLSADHKRGVPEYTQVLEKVLKLDRYTEASVSKEEQAAKILFSIEHSKDSTGEDPLADIAKSKIGLLNDVVTENDPYVLADGLANRITQTTSNQTFNMPIGSKLNPFNVENASSYKDFYDPNFDSIAASVDTPPEVARQSYNSNYTASKAAINTWEHITEWNRKKFSDQFYLPIFKMWFYTEVLKGKIDAPGFTKALSNNNIMAIEAYTQCKFVGKKMPHVDPLKEIKAIREMLGNPTMGIVPLISNEQASEMAGVGDFRENYEEYLEEKKIILDEKPKVENSNNDNI